MTPGLKWLLIAWGIMTGILLILLFYRSMLTMQEDDQLFIDESSASRATEQSQLIARVNKINPLVKLVGATSGLMILAIAGWAVYLGLNRGAQLDFIAVDLRNLRGGDGERLLVLPENRHLAFLNYGLGSVSPLFLDREDGAYRSHSGRSHVHIEGGPVAFAHLKEGCTTVEPHIAANVCEIQRNLTAGIE